MPWRPGRRRSRRSRRARRARAAAAAGAPSSSRSRRGRRRRTRGGSPSGSNHGSCSRGAQRVDASSRPARGDRRTRGCSPSSHASSSCAGHEGAHGRRRRASGAASGSGSGTRIWRSSRSRAKPASATARVVVGVRAVDPVGDVAAALVARPASMAAASSSSRRASATPGSDRELQRPLAGVVVREVRVAASPRRRRGAPAVADRAAAVAARSRSSSPNGHDAGRGLDRVGERAHARRRRRARSSSQHRGRSHRGGGYGPSGARARLRATDGTTSGGAMEMTSYEPGCRRGSTSAAPTSTGRGRLLLRRCSAGSARGARGGRRLPRRATIGGQPVAGIGPAAEPRPAGVGHATSNVESADDDRGEGHRGRRAGVRAADGRARRSAAWPCSPTRSARSFSVWQAGDAPGRAARQRAGHVVVERAAHHRRRRVEGVLRRGVRLGRRHARRRPEGVHRVAGERPLGRRDDGEAADDAGRGAAVLGACTSRSPTPTPRWRTSPSSAARC